MKKLKNLNGSKILTKSQQKSVLGAGGQTFVPMPAEPCGDTGASPTNDTYHSCIGYGYVWSQDQCWVCH